MPRIIRLGTPPEDLASGSDLRRPIAAVRRPVRRRA